MSTPNRDQGRKPRRPGNNTDTRKPWEKRRDERLLRHRKEQYDMALAKYNSTKHISPSDVRALSRKDLLDMWAGVKQSDNSLDKATVMKEIKRRAKKITIDGVTDPVELLSLSIAASELKDHPVPPSPAE